MKFPIYLDYSATTPVDPRVVDKMIPFLYENIGTLFLAHKEEGFDLPLYVQQMAHD